MEKILPILAYIIIYSLSIWTHISVYKFRQIPFKLIIITYSLIILSIFKYFDPDFTKTASEIIQIPPSLADVIYFPLFIMKAYFSTDKYLFFNALPFIMYVSTIVVLTGIVIFACIVKLMWEWDWASCLLFGVIMTPTQSQFTMSFLSDHKYKDTRIKMEGESLVNLGFVFCYFEILLGMSLRDDMDLTKCVLIFCYKIILGIVIGYVVGLLLIFFIKSTTKSADSCCIIMLLYNLSIYIIIQLLSISPYFTLLTMGVVIMQYKDQMMEDNVIKIQHFIEIFHNLVNFTIFTYAVMKLYCFGIATEPRDALLTYIIMMLTRATSFFISHPVLKAICPSYNAQKYLMMVWTKIVSNATLLMTINFVVISPENEKARSILSLVFFSAMITHSLNSMSFVFYIQKRLIGRKTLDQIKHMVSALKDIYHQKECYIIMWKVKNIMCDIRWDIVKEVTEFKLPYNIEDMDDYDGQLLQLAPKTATCPDCKKVVYAELSVKGKNEMKIEATRRILKEMSNHLVRQYSLGLLTTECSLVVKKMISESEDIIIDMTEVKTYFKNNAFLELLKKLFHHIVKFNEKMIRKPRKPFRIFCYNVVMSKHYKRAIFFVNVFSIYPILVFVLARTHNIMFYTAVVTNWIFMLSFTTNMIMTIYAYSFIYIKDGIKIYFSSYCHVLDFVIVVMSIVDVSVNAYFILNDSPFEWREKFYFSRLTRLVVLLKVFQGKFFKILRLFEELVDIRVAFGFEIIKTFRNCYDDILLRLNKIIVDNYELEMECRQCIENGRWAILEMILKIQLEKPWVAVSVKTKHVMNAVVKSMYATLYDLKKSGFLDDFEYDKLTTNIKYVEMRRPVLAKSLNMGSEIINGIAWMSTNDELLEFVIENSLPIVFKAGSVICVEDEYLNGIYIVISGVCKTEYTPRVSTMDRLFKEGSLPVIDFIDTNVFDRYRYELILPGNTFGELCYLTNRPYDANIIATCDVHTILFSNEVIDEAIKRDMDTIDGLGARMWKAIVYDMCLWILSSQQVFEHLMLTHLRQKLERSFMPNLARFQKMYLNSEIEDLILIDGRIASLVDDQKFIAPCYIPRTVTSFSLTMNERTRMNAVILIIPIPDADMTLLMNKLIETSNLAIDNETEYSQRRSKVSFCKPIIRKDGWKVSSSMFNPLEMLKLYKKKK